MPQMTSLVMDLFELIEDQAPPEQFEAVLSALLDESGTDIADDDPTVVKMREASLHISETLARHRRRERELFAIYETVSDLSSLRDLDKVLSAIVRRARQLLGTDVAYLMLIDPESSYTYMRATEGTVTSAFRDIRLDFGVGLGGLVAQTATPYWTSDYRNDERFKHVIDNVVADEDLVAILGVPLELGRRVLGVLFASDRSVRNFSVEEVALLVSLAGHAAVALENATLFNDLQHAVAELEKANRTIREYSTMIERAADTHEQLTLVATEGGSARDVVTVLANSLQRAVLLVGPSGVMEAAGIEPGDELWHEDPELRSPEQAELFEHVEQVLANHAPRIVSRDTSEVRLFPIVANQQPLAVLVIDGPPLRDLGARTCERAGLVIALLLTLERASVVAEEKVRHDLLGDILAIPQRDPAGLTRRAALLDLDLDLPYSVVVLRPPDPSDRGQLSSRLADVATRMSGLLTELGDDLVMLIPGPSPAEALARVQLETKRAGSTSPTMGCVGPRTGLGEVAGARVLAVQCVDTLIALGRAGEAVEPKELGVFGLLLAGARPEAVSSFVSDQVGLIRSYDVEKGTNLLETLEVYFDTGGHVRQAAADMFIHVNTLYQRLERVDQLLGIDWRHGENALQLHLAIKLQPLIADSAGPDSTGRLSE